MFQPVQTSTRSFSRLPAKHEGSTVQSQRDWPRKTRPPGDEDDGDDDDDGDASAGSPRITSTWLVGKSGRESLRRSATVLEAIQRKSLFATNGLGGGGWLLSLAMRAGTY